MSSETITLHELVESVDVLKGVRMRAVAAILGDHIVFDVLGRPCVAVDVAVDFVDQRRKADERRTAANRESIMESVRRRAPTLKGMPAIEGASAFESVAAGDPAYRTPAQEFGRGNPTSELLDDALAEGQQQIKANREKGRAARLRRKTAKTLAEVDRLLEKGKADG